MLPAHSTMAHNKILEGMEPNSITIIGERHQRPEAIQFFQSIVTKHLQQNKCLIIGLEIPSNQQPLLDKMIQGEAVISDIEIPPTIDHQTLRELISDLVEILPDGKRKEGLDIALKELMEELFGSRILSFNQQTALAYAPLISRARNNGCLISVADGQIAAIAIVHGFTIATRDVAPFVAARVPAINPWEQESL